MTETQRKLELTSWILVPAAPLLCMWIPSAVILRAPAGDTLGSMLVSVVAPAAPFVILSVFIHIKNQNAKDNRLIVGTASSLIATAIFTLLFYIYFWHSVFNSTGVDFRAVFAFMFSPILISLIIPVAYGIGRLCTKEG